MKFRKYAAIALAGAMCMSLLAGCGDKKDDTSKGFHNSIKCRGNIRREY